MEERKMRVKCSYCGKLIQKDDGIKIPVFYNEEFKMEINKYYCKECNKIMEVCDNGY